MSHALIVEDDADTASAMSTLIAHERFTVSSAGSLHEARRQMVLHPPDLVLLDMHLPDGNGLDLLSEQKLTTQSEVVLITGHASVETSIQAFRLGATDYLVKPVNLGHLRAILSRVMRPSVLQAEIETLDNQLAREGHFGVLWGRAPSMRRVYDQIARVAGTSITVLITGESGTGKELIARTLHDVSRRRNKPFLAVNCGAISAQLIESEIFGHEKGSFTGAERQHQGFFERANGGTLFLDEITEMPQDLQVKLLRVLESRSFMRVGSTQTLEADVRVVAATNRNLQQAVACGSLREDLLYRLNVFPIDAPPLRQRSEDVPLLAAHFLQAICQREGERKSFTPAAVAALAAQRWPGNVRQLRNVVQRAYVMSPGATIGDEWVVADPAPEPASRLQRPLLAAQGQPHRPPPPAAGAPSIQLLIGTSMADAEKQLILATLAHFQQQKERTAAALGISLKTLYNRLKEYGVPNRPAPLDADLPGP